MQNRLKAEQYIEGVLSQDRIILSKAITLVESRLESDRKLAEKVLEGILSHTGKSLRIGITGVPGVGKSTFIETFGKYLCNEGKKIAILAIDPSSQVSKGSIMGDKTRMETLSNDPNAFIRPSPSGASLGGVANKTRESILLCEAAGFEIILVETVGVGQSETIVKEMVDFFLLLMLAGAGDELQGIKRGIMEMADALVITKSDGENLAKAKSAALEYKNALHLYPLNENNWQIPVLTCSALSNQGIAEIWETMCLFDKKMLQSGYKIKNRQKQNIKWMHDAIKQKIEQQFYANPKINATLASIEQQILVGEILPLVAAKNLLELQHASNS